MDKKPDPSAQPVWRPRFDLAGLMLLMLIFCVMAAAGNYMVQALNAGTRPKAIFTLFTYAAPMGLLLVIVFCRLLLRQVKRWQRR